MSVPATVLQRLDDGSDWFSPIVVKEVRQIVRSRDFTLSFSASLAVAVAIAFYGAADATAGLGTSGRGTFTALMVCLTLLGMLVVPMGAFGALRVERMEQTLDLVTVTALSPRRIVIGKLMAQAVKLLTLFSAMAPFIAMSFLLGGIDLVTILLSLLVLFCWSLWASAAFLFCSTLFKSRAMSGVIFGIAGIVLLLLLTFGQLVSFFMFRGGVSYYGAGAGGRSSFGWGLAMVMTGCIATTVNLVLLAENRLSVPTENRVTALRVGFLGQFLLILAWALTYLGSPLGGPDAAVQGLTIVGALDLAIVAVFAVTDDLRVPRRARLEMERTRWSWMFALFGPGGGRGAAYVLAQMVLLMLAALLLAAPTEKLTRLLAACGYICCFSGVPTLAWRLARPFSDRTLQLRVVLLLLVAAVLLLPDLVYYVFWQPDVFDLAFGRRHLLNPFRTLANWDVVGRMGWTWITAVIGLTGVAAYAALIVIGARVTREEQRATAAD